MKTISTSSCVSPRGSDLRRIGTEIIGNLDDDGYLRAENSEIAERCGVEPDQVEKVLALIQSFDPPGVAARNIQECLLIQLKVDPNPDPVSVEIVEQHFDDLTRRRYPDIARALKLSLDRIMESVEEIMASSRSRVDASAATTRATSSPTWSCTRWGRNTWWC